MPTHLKQLRGNPGKRRLDSNEPIPPGELNEPREWMTVSQKEGWNYAIDHAPAGLLKRLDRSALVAWVVAEHLHRNASPIVEKFGMLTKAPHTGLPIQSPYLPIVNKQASIMLKAAELLGFSPSRDRVSRSKSKRHEVPANGTNWREIDRTQSRRSSNGGNRIPIPRLEQQILGGRP